MNYSELRRTILEKMIDLGRFTLEDLREATSDIDSDEKENVISKLLDSGLFSRSSVYYIYQK